MNEITTNYISFIIITGAAVAIEHLAFRTPKWQRRELARRAIGDTTLLVLFYVLVVLPGAADFITWVMLIGGFVVAGAVKVIATQYDKAQRKLLLARMEGDARDAD